VDPEAKVNNPTTGLTLLWSVNHSGGNSTTDKSHGRKQDGLLFVENYYYFYILLFSIELVT
jgi:hypothetical protein